MRCWVLSCVFINNWSCQCSHCVSESLKAVSIYEWKMKKPLWYCCAIRPSRFCVFCLMCTVWCFRKISCRRLIVICRQIVCSTNLDSTASSLSLTTSFCLLSSPVCPVCSQLYGNVWMCFCFDLISYSLLLFVAYQAIFFLNLHCKVVSLHMSLVWTF